MKKPDLFRKDRRWESKEKVERKERIETLYAKYTICQENAKNNFPVMFAEQMSFFDKRTIKKGRR